MLFQDESDESTWMDESELPDGTMALLLVFFLLMGGQLF